MATTSAADQKSVEKSVMPGRNGGTLRRGSQKGNTPGSGRPTNDFKGFLAKLRANPKLHKALETAASDPESRGFNAALKLLSDYDNDKPAEKKEIAGKVEVTVRIAREGRRVTAG